MSEAEVSCETVAQERHDLITALLVEKYRPIPARKANACVLGPTRQWELHTLSTELSTVPAFRTATTAVPNLHDGVTPSKRQAS